MVDRAVRALVFAGGLLFVLGLAYGLWPVGDDCGTGFSPNVSGGLKGNAAECAVVVAGRANQAWFFVILALGLLAGAIGLSRSSEPLPVAAAQEG